jgi:DNA-binding response OmpR family regulator
MNGNATFPSPLSLCAMWSHGRHQAGSIGVNGLDAGKRVEGDPVVERPRPRIVVVDDDPQLAELMHEFLTGEGYDVRICSQGDQAFAVVQTLLPDLIILDVRMAEVNGLGVLYLLSMDERTRQIPVLMCTAVSSGDMQPWEDVLDQKGVPILFKPFALSELAARVDSMLRHAETGSAGS